MQTGIYLTAALAVSLLVGNITITCYYKWANIINFTSIDVAVKPEKAVGLWEICRFDYNQNHNSLSPADCANIDPLSIPSGIIPMWVNWVRALMIFSCIFNFVACLIYWAVAPCSIRIKLVPKNIKIITLGYAASFFLLISAVMTLTACSVWTVNLQGSDSFIGSSDNFMLAGMGYGMGITPITMGDCVIVGWVISGLGLLTAGFGCYITASRAERANKELENYDEFGYQNGNEIDFNYQTNNGSTNKMGSLYNPEIYGKKQKIYNARSDHFIKEDKSYV